MIILMMNKQTGETITDGQFTDRGLAHAKENVSWVVKMVNMGIASKRMNRAYEVMGNDGIELELFLIFCEDNNWIEITIR